MRACLRQRCQEDARRTCDDPRLLSELLGMPFHIKQEPAVYIVMGPMEDTMLDGLMRHLVGQRTVFEQACTLEQSFAASLASGSIQRL